MKPPAATRACSPLAVDGKSCLAEVTLTLTILESWSMNHVALPTSKKVL